MKVIAKPIDAIVVFKGEGNPIPYKFRYTDNYNEKHEIYIGKIIYTEKRRLAGVEMLVYECQTSIEDADIRYQLKYYINNCKWELYKI